jgi:hypothetical protein
VLGLGHESIGTWLKARPKVAKAIVMALFRRLSRTPEYLSDLVFLTFIGEQKSIN